MKSSQGLRLAILSLVVAIRASKESKKMKRGSSSSSTSGAKTTKMKGTKMAKTGLRVPSFGSGDTCSSLEPPLAGVMGGTDRPKIILANDIDYPPYAQLGPAADDFPISGFGPDFAVLALEGECGYEVHVAQTSWGRCWGNNQIGEGLAMGEFHGCTTYTHSAGVRNRYLEFSSPILRDNKAAGILTRLDANGNPVIDGNSDLNGVNVVDVIGWAPTADNLAIVSNVCAGGMPFQGYNLVPPSYSTNVANDDALRTLLDGDADAMWVYADQAELYSCANSGPGDPWDCTLWDGLGTTFAYVQTGMFGWARGGTTLSISKLGSGVADLLNPCIAAFLETESYYDLCVEYDLVELCFPNSFFPNGAGANQPLYNLPTNELTTSCSDGYCSCP